MLLGNSSIKKPRKKVAALLSNNFGGNSAQSLLSSSPFYAQLTKSLVLNRGTGSPTYTGASAKTVRDHEGVLRTTISGEARFEGARRVRNLFSSSEVFSSGWTNTNVILNPGASGGLPNVQSHARFNSDVGSPLLGQSPTFVVGNVYMLSFYIMLDTGLEPNIGAGNYRDFTIVRNGGDVTSYADITNASLGGGVYRCSYKYTYSSGGIFVRKYAATNTATGFVISGMQLEDITGRADQTTPSEYVSVGALDYRSSQDPLYLSLPGTAGHYASTPDSAAVASVATGAVFVCEIDIAHGNWTGASNKYLVTQSNTTGNQRAFSCGVAAGVMFIYVSLDGATFDTGTSINSTAALPAYFANSARGKLRYSRTAATGAIQFHYSTDGGVTWTQSGTDKTSTAGALFNSNSVLELGTANAGTDPGISNSGSWYRVQLCSSLGGTPVVDFNPHRDATTPTGTIASSTTGEVWTINGASSVVRNAVYHGAGVDGVKYFDTDLSGNPIV